MKQTNNIQLPMKPSAQHHPLRSALSLIAAFALLAAPAPGAEKKPPESAKPSHAPALSSDYDISIVDGVFVWEGQKLEPTLGNLIDALRERYSEANIALAPGLAKLKISDLKLRTGRLTDELEAIRVASGGKFAWLCPGSPEPNMPVGPLAMDPRTGLPRPAPDANTGLFILRDPAPTEENERVVEAFNIGPYLEWVTGRTNPAQETLMSHKDPKAQHDAEVPEDVDKLNLMIRETIATLKQGKFNDTDQPSFQFHRGANLLVVIGTREAVDVARKVVSALPGQAFLGGRAPGSGPHFGSEAGPSPASAQDEAFRRRYGLGPAPTPAPGAIDPTTGLPAAPNRPR